MMRQTGTLLGTLVGLAAIAAAPFVTPGWVLAGVVILACLVVLAVYREPYPTAPIMVLAVLFGLQVIPLLVFALTLAIMLSGELAARYADGTLYSRRGRRIEEKRRLSAGEVPPAYLWFIGVSLVVGLVVSWALGHPDPLLVLMGITVALLLKAILEDREDAFLVEVLGVAMTIHLFNDLEFTVDAMNLIAAAILAFSFGYFAYRARAMDLSGLFSGALVGILLIVFADVRWFLVLLIFFALGSGTTRYRFDYKRRIGVEEGKSGVRGYRNVFANGIVAAAAAVLYGVTQNPACIALFLGSVATAAADTVASEIGVTGSIPYLITTFERVRPGTNGGVTLVGEGVACIAALVIGLVALAVGIADPVLVLVTVAAGFVGTNVDSLVGALFENRGLIGNSGTNLVATVSGGIFAALFYLH
ncbi:MAG: TIGR00297 family protein [Methanoregulaceae archaeon]